MMDEELDDDTHLCIKCRTTIIGLDNYVRHRKTNCSDPIGVINKKALDDINSYGNEEAQRSGANHGNIVANNPNDATGANEKPHHTGQGNGIDDPEKNKEFPFPYDLGGNSSGDVVSNLNENCVSTDSKLDTATESQLLDNYIYGLGADVFFYSLELQSNSKRGTSSPAKHGSYRKKTRKTNTPSVPNSLMELPNIDQLDKFIGGQKKHENIFGLFHNESMEEDDEGDVDDLDIVGDGKWKLGNNTHKYIPNSPQWDMRTHNWIIPEDNSSDKGDNLNKSIEEDNDEHMEEEYKGYSPPPSHTRGKWIPGSKMIKYVYPSESQLDNSLSEEFWCSLCDRRLTSKLTYERHLKSNMHTKKIERNNEFDKISRVECAEVPTASPDSNLPLKRKRILCKKFSTKTIAELGKRAPSVSPKKSKRKRKCYFIKCSVCAVRVRTHLFGKHLISHFHYRCMSKNYDKSIEIILNNMDKIVQHSPFQCQPCRFYANTQNAFLRHWNSPEHRGCVDKSDDGNGRPGRTDGRKQRFWCSQCKYDCDTNIDMRSHLLDFEHQQVIQIINRSVPIIIRKRRILCCENCEQEFHYNIELQKHKLHCTVSYNTTSMPPETITQDCKGSNNYWCSACNVHFKSRVSFQNHGKKYHSKAQYFCSICDMSFETTTESKQHRRTAKHKILAAKKGGKQEIIIKTCKICKEFGGDILELKEHISTNHPESKHSCPHCGEIFILPQEVSRHVRDKICKFYNDNNNPVETMTLTKADAANTILCLIENDNTNVRADVAIIEDALVTTADITRTPPTTTSTFTAVPVSSSSTASTSNPPTLSENSTFDKFITIMPLEMNVLSEVIIHTTAANQHLYDDNDDSHYSETVDVIETDERTVAKPKQLLEIPCTSASSSAVAAATETTKPFAIPNPNEIQTYECEFCPFITQSNAEHIFHQVLHTSSKNKNDIEEKFPCPICKKSFRKSSLRCHLRYHTNERTFQCTICPMSFVRKSNLKNHIANIHEKQKANTDAAGEGVDADDSEADEPTNPLKLLSCTICGKKFTTSHLLKQHSHTHRDQLSEIKRHPCQHVNCIYSGRSAAELRNHMVIHSNEKQFACEKPNCDYRTKTKAHLKRHSKTHGKPEKELVCSVCEFKTSNSAHFVRHKQIHAYTKIFNCPHCEYSCNNADNLRKHIISTKKHSGRSLYECKLCENDVKYATNYLREYNAHLVLIHNIRITEN